MTVFSRDVSDDLNNLVAEYLELDNLEFLLSPKSRSFIDMDLNSIRLEDDPLLLAILSLDEIEPARTNISSGSPS